MWNRVATEIYNRPEIDIRYTNQFFGKSLKYKHTSIFFHISRNVLIFLMNHFYFIYWYSPPVPFRCHGSPLLK